MVEGGSMVEGGAWWRVKHSGGWSMVECKTLNFKKLLKKVSGTFPSTY